MGRTSLWCLALFLADAGCFIALGISMKMEGYPDHVNPFIRWRPVALFLREHGLALLLLIAVWAVAAAVLAHQQEHPTRARVVLAVGSAMAVVLAAAFMTYATSPYTRPLLYYMGH
jgi:hypothetical protein